MEALGFLSTSNLLYDNCRQQFPVFRAFPSLQYWRVQQAAKPLPDFVAETFCTMNCITPAIKCRRILRRINFHLQGGRRRRSGATSTDDNAANGNSDKTLFIAFNNCYILSPKSPQTLENTKFIASVFALGLSLVLYPFPSCYEPS